MESMKKIILLFIAALVGFSSCMEMYLPPKNTVTDEELMGSSNGMAIYLAKMYSMMPFEDFKYTSEWGITFNGWLQAPGIDGCGEAICKDGIFQTFRSESTPFWNLAFVLIHDANHLIETLPNYKSIYSDLEYNYYIGQAYFVRAYTFYRMAIRFGGIPLVLNTIKYPAEAEDLEVPRATEEDTWNQICKDFDMAVSLLPETPFHSELAGKFAALAFKAEAMLYAGSVAKYNQTVPGGLTGFGSKTNVRVMGFDPNTDDEASQRYFAEAYKAAREVMKSGKFSLYKKKWSATDRNAQYQNMVDMFSDLGSPENIFVKTYIGPSTTTHSIDGFSQPYIFYNPVSSKSCPSLDFVELFDGFDRYPDGTIKVTTGNSNTEGEYLLFDTTMDFFKNAEPRLRAYVILPGDMFRNAEIELRTGIYTGPTPIAPLWQDYSYSNATTNLYQKHPMYTGSPKTLYMSEYDVSHEFVEIDGKMWTASGANGPFYKADNNEANLSGFYLRKWLSTNPDHPGGEGNSDQPFILMRYADVLLAAAEAGVELSIAGAASPVEGDNMLAVASQAINDIRERAGANLLASNLTADEDSRNIVRKERRKELAFEHKTKWDVRRWRVQHYEARSGFWGGAPIPEGDKRLGNNSGYRLRGLYPFYSSEAKKYFFDANFHLAHEKELQYNPVDYYFEIPSGEVAKSPVIDQQPNR